MSKAPQVEQAANARELAKRARRLAGTLMDGPDKDGLLDYANELEAQAAALEAVPPVTQPQLRIPTEVGHPFRFEAGH
jgi:hypothetical protein